MFLLMIAALLIGWFIGWFLRRSSSRKKYIRQIDQLAHQDESMAEDLHIKSANYENNARHLEHTQDKLSFAKQQADEYSDRSVELQSNIENFHLSQKKLEEDLLRLDDKIKSTSGDLDILTSQKDEILESKNKIVEYEENINLKATEIDNISENISALSSERESLNTKVSNEEEHISLKQQEIDAENDKIKVIEDEFASKKAEIMDEVEGSRKKALNYQYAVNYVNEKIDAKETISFDTVDKIISKNEEQGMFANLIQKLFGKSAKYIKGGK
jgi:chromosome segregation ATPase